MQATVDISNALTIPGWMSEKELLWLAHSASECHRIVEFGCFHGRSTRVLGDHVKKGGRVYAVDPWNGDYPDENGAPLEMVNTYVFPNFMQNLRDLVAAKVVVPHRGFSYSFHLPYPVDMVFLDGDHRYETVHKDIDKALELLNPGGILCGHDYGHPRWEGVKRAVDERFTNIHVEDTIWSVRK